jgi:hypothetical protein
MVARGFVDNPSPYLSIVVTELQAAGSISSTGEQAGAF